ncbi:MAG: hypothetical protein IKO47_02845 [Ruminococcus sp.]|nr:hypothetical protein [Ruminococcus sp.]
MNKLKSFFKKYWITLWLVVSVTAAVGVFSYSAYIQDQNREKRVVANMGDSGKRFSSDRLSAITTPSPNEVPVAANSVNPTIDFHIYNFSSKDNTRWYPGEIYYTVEAKLVNNDGTAINEADFAANSYGIKKGTSGETDYFSSYNEIKTLSGNFTGTASDSSQIFTLFLPASQIEKPADEKVYIELTATPFSDPGHTTRINELDILKARLSLTSEAKNIKAKGWSAVFTEQDANITYDGFNLVISGSGKSNIIICYDSSRIEISKYFTDDHPSGENSEFRYENGKYNANGLISESGTTTWKSILIGADSDIASRYDIQVYMKGSSGTIPQTDLNNYIYCLTNVNDDAAAFSHPVTTTTEAIPGP